MKDAPSVSIDTSLVAQATTDVKKVTLPLPLIGTESNIFCFIYGVVVEI